MHIFHPLGLIPISVRSVLKKKSPRSGAAAACGCGPIRGRESGERCFRAERTLTRLTPLEIVGTQVTRTVWRLSTFDSGALQYARGGVKRSDEDTANVMNNRI